MFSELTLRSVKRAHSPVEESAASNIDEIPIQKLGMIPMRALQLLNGTQSCLSPWRSTS